MTTQPRSILLPAVALCTLALMAFTLVPGTLSPTSYTAVVAVFLALATIVIRTYAQAHETRSLAQLVSRVDAGITERHEIR